MNQQGARFLAESKVWLASEAAAAAAVEAPADRPVEAAMAPLGETAAGHMGAPELARFVGWKAGLPARADAGAIQTGD
jgi:hypothetical protein